MGCTCEGGAGCEMQVWKVVELRTQFDLEITDPSGGKDESSFLRPVLDIYTTVAT